MKKTTAFPFIFPGTYALKIFAADSKRNLPSISFNEWDQGLIFPVTRCNATPSGNDNDNAAPGIWTNSTCTVFVYHYNSTKSPNIDGFAWDNSTQDAEMIQGFPNRGTQHPFIMDVALPYQQKWISCNLAKLASHNVNNFSLFSNNTGER